MARTMVAAEPPSLTNETQHPVTNLGIDENHADGVVQIDRIELPDFVVLEFVDIVAEHRLISTRSLAHLLKGVIFGGNGLMAGIGDIQVQHKKLSGSLGCRSRSWRQRCIDLTTHFRS